MIEQKAAKVVATYWNGVLPVDVYAISARMGILVQSDDLGGVSGQITFENGQLRIVANRGDRRVRQRFAVAHEIGHWMLGHLQESYSLFWDAPNAFSSTVGGLEREANEFAAALLIPAKALRSRENTRRAGSTF